MQGTKQKLKVKRTPFLRIAAVAVALMIIGGLGFTVNKQTGNPISAWYTARKIAAHYNAYHPGEGYVVGPAKFSYAGIDSAGEWKQYYICNVYKTGSVDTGFTAIFRDGAVSQCESATTKSGTNTYNRFKNALNAELAAAGVRDTMGLVDGNTLFADFYEPDMQRDLFNPVSPVFVQDSPFDRTNLPLHSVVCMMQLMHDSAQITLEALAQRLCDLKKACDDAGVPFDFYSVQIYANSTGYALAAMDAPAAEIATYEKAFAYVTALQEKNQLGEPYNMYPMSVASRKMDWLGIKSQFEVCTH